MPPRVVDAIVEWIRDPRHLRHRKLNVEFVRSKERGCEAAAGWMTIGTMRSPRLRVLVAFLLVAEVVVSVGAAGCRRDGGAAQASYDDAVTIDASKIEFDDGDTFLYRNEAIRVLGIDTPETEEPDVGIFEDQPYGRAAAESTRTLIVRARRVEIVYDGRDIYDRKLAHVFVDGELLAEKILAMGLAYENVSHFGDNGFPDLADRILRAAEAGPKPPFEPPHRWRKKHQKKTN